MSIYKIKIFTQDVDKDESCISCYCYHEVVQRIQDEINKWFGEKPFIKIERQSICQSDSGRVIIMITYRE